MLTDRLPDAESANSGHLSAIDLAVPIQCHFGCSCLTLDQVKALAEGDVVRIRQWNPVIFAGVTAIGYGAFEENTLVMEFEDIDDHASLGPASRERGVDGKVDLNRLSIACAFTLPIREIPLADLAALTSGDVLTLDPRAVQEVQLRVGDQCLATGELVQLGDAVAFEVRRVSIK